MFYIILQYKLNKYYSSERVWLFYEFQYIIGNTFYTCCLINDKCYMGINSQWCTYKA